MTVTVYYFALSARQKTTLVNINLEIVGQNAFQILHSIARFIKV